MELRMATGKRNRPDVDQQLNAIRFKKADEFLDGPRRMTDPPQKKRFGGICFRSARHLPCVGNSIKIKSAGCEFCRG